jgi:hypothetical protein
MSLAWILVVVSVVAPVLLAILLRRRRLACGGDLDQIATRIQEVNVDNFRNLIDPAEQIYLHDHLPFLQFRRVHYERMRAAAEYLWSEAMNARLMIQLAEAAKRNAGPAVVETAERLQRNATQVCLHAYRVVPRLWLSAVVPSVDKRADLVAETYANVLWEASTLKTLLHYGRARAA